MEENTNSMSRYSRQTALPQIGVSGQQKIQSAAVLVVGAGGLGCPALLYLCAAGIGHIGIADADVVALSNLNRQTLFTPADVGKPKAHTAAQKLHHFNPNIRITVYNEEVTNQNALQILQWYDVIIDGTDNFTTRYMLSDACSLLQKPLVYGAVYGFEGQVAVFHLPQSNQIPAIGYRHLFPQPPPAGQTPNCAVGGVLGVLPGIVGTMQAAEALKIITGAGAPLAGKLLTFNLLQQVWHTVEIPPQPSSLNRQPQTNEAFWQYNYPAFCHSHTGSKPLEIDSNQFAQLLHKSNVVFVDVRQEDELPDVTRFTPLRIPLARLPDALIPPDAQTTLVFFCQTGKRSLTAAQIVGNAYPQCRTYSLKNGMQNCCELFI